MVIILENVIHVLKNMHYNEKLCMNGRTNGHTKQKHINCSNCLYKKTKI